MLAGAGAARALAAPLRSHADEARHRHRDAGPGGLCRGGVGLRRQRGALGVVRDRGPRGPGIEEVLAEGLAQGLGHRDRSPGLLGALALRDQEPGIVLGAQLDGEAVDAGLRA